MDELSRILDAARCAMKSKFPTDILVTAGGFRVVAHHRGVRAIQVVRRDDFEVAGANLLVEAVHKANRELGSCFGPVQLDAV